MDCVGHISLQERDSYIELWKQTSAELEHLQKTEQVGRATIQPHSLLSVLHFTM